MRPSVFVLRSNLAQFQGELIWTKEGTLKHRRCEGEVLPTPILGIRVHSPFAVHQESAHRFALLTCGCPGHRTEALTFTLHSEVRSDQVAELVL